MSDPTSRKKSMTLTALLSLTALGLAVATTAGRLGRFWWVADLFSHFAVYLALASATLLLLAVLLKRHKTAVAFLPILGINTWIVFPAFDPFDEIMPTQGPPLSLAQANILYTNHDSEHVLAYIRQCDADILFLQEINLRWAKVIGESDIPYHFEVLHSAEGSFGIAMLVRKTLNKDRISIGAMRVIDFADADSRTEWSAIEATLLLAGRRVKILSIHPPPPTTAGYTAIRNSILQQVRQWSDAQTNPHVIIGDFNTTPWSHAFTILMDGGGLVNSLDGRGNQGSWPAHIPVPWLLPIDHCVFSPEWVCTERSIGDAIGSDHRPLLVTLELVE